MFIPLSAACHSSSLCVLPSNAASSVSKHTSTAPLPPHGAIRSLSQALSAAFVEPLFGPCRPNFSSAVSASSREEKRSNSNPYQLAYVSCTAKRKKFRPLFGFRTAHQVLCLHSRVYRAPIAAADRRRAWPRILFVSICVHSWSPVFSRSARPQSGSRFGRCFGDGSPSKSWSLRGTSRFSLLFRVYILPA